MDTLQSISGSFNGYGSVTSSSFHVTIRTQAEAQLAAIKHEATQIERDIVTQAVNAATATDDTALEIIHSRLEQAKGELERVSHKVKVLEKIIELAKSIEG